jgi:general secretion pathway protein C
MKQRSIQNLLFLALTAFFCGPVFVNACMARGEAAQGISLQLVGIAIGDDAREKFAILKIRSTGGQGVFREGDRLDNILIKKIMPGYIVINTGEGDVTLSLDSGEESESFPSSQQITRLDRKEVNSTYPNYMQFMRIIGVRPHVEEGRPGGFLIYNVYPDSLLSRAGLQNGDVIVGLNGRAITTTGQAIDFYEALMSGGTISLEIKRGGKTQDLQFIIQ